MKYAPAFTQFSRCRISQIRLEILKAFYEILGSGKQTDAEVETEAQGQDFLREIEMQQNDDLVEADRSHLEMELEEQEGAVGGILEERGGSGNAQVRIFNFKAC